MQHIRLADQYDQEVLGYLAGYKQSALHSAADTVNDQVNGTKAVSTAGSDELLSSMKLKKGDFGNITTSSAGDHSIPVAARLPGATALPTATASPAMVVARMARLLDQQQVDKDGRWLVVDPVFMEILRDEDSRLFNADFGESGGLRNGLVLNNFHGFRVYVQATYHQSVQVQVQQVLLTKTLTMVLLLQVMILLSQLRSKSIRLKLTVIQTALLTLFVVCIYMVERSFVLKVSLMPSTTQRKGGLNYGIR